MLDPSSRLQEARTVDENWMGKADPRERRKLQNRLHQRAWRQRRADHTSRGRLAQARTESVEGPKDLDQAFAEATAALTMPSTPHSPRLNTHLGQNTQTNIPKKAARCGPISRAYPAPYSLQDLMTMNLHSLPLHICRESSSSPAGTRKFPPSINLVKPGESRSDIHYRLLDFTISSDHYLITLIQYNVMRAIMTNIAMCSLLHTLGEECQAALGFLTANPHLQEPRSRPPAFLPSSFQLATPHAAWIDSVPCSQLRENLIRYQELFDEDDFCNDICGGLWDGLDDCETKGMLVWGDPWHISSWEITERFARKWSFLLEGCHEMAESTNRWRAQRGEEPLVIELGEIE